jgi:hypothetical protein
MKKYLLYIFLFSGMLMWNCGGDDPVAGLVAPPTPPVDKPDTIPDDPVDSLEVIYDETKCLYTSYDGLVMAGYQGWFSCQGDPTKMGWVHYPKDGSLRPGSVSIDFWPDMTEYEKQYAAPGFKHADGSQAYLFSSGDYETVDTHFRWMKEYGIDGVFVQRFVSQTTGGAAKERVNMVLQHCLKAAKKYDRAIAIMYDGSAGSEQDYERITSDWNELVELFDLYNSDVNPTYLHHNGKPVFSLWGYGFTSRGFDPLIFDRICENIRGAREKKVSIMLGVPYNWRTLSGDCVDDERFHESLRKWADIISPWAVGRYNPSNVATTIATNVTADQQWCTQNGLDYVPVAYPGFSWRNMKGGDNQYDATPRNRGKFIWDQVVAATMADAKSLYVAMFDELDEGTCIFKTTTNSTTPLNISPTTPDGKFIGIDDDLGSDYYLWLVGEARKVIRNGGGSMSPPVRSN